MKTALFALFSLLMVFTGIAAATNHTLVFDNAGKVWALTKTAQPFSTRTGSVMSSFELGKCAGSDCPFHGQSGAIVTAVAKDSSGAVLSPAWNYVKCYAIYDTPTDEADYLMVFDAPTGTWPTVWPATLTCSGTCTAAAGACTPGDTLDVTVKLGPVVDPDFAGDPLASITLAGGKTLTMKKQVATGKKVQAGSFEVKLPAGNYTDSTIQARKSGGAVWTGMTCIIDERGAGTVDRMSYVVTPDAVAHTGGYCTINGTNSPVSLVRE